jgi:hypothetical protein
MRPSLCVIPMIVCVGIGCGHTPPAGQPQPTIEAAPAPRQVESLEDLVRTINDDPDILRADYTPSVDKLIKVGEPAIPRVIDLMLSEHEDTRLRAQRVLEGVTLRQHGFVVGQGWKDDKGRERWRTLWRQLGDLDWKAPSDDRERAVKLWRAWLGRNKV